MYICIEKYCSIFVSSYCVLEVKFRVKTFVKQKKDNTTQQVVTIRSENLNITLNVWDYKYHKTTKIMC